MHVFRRGTCIIEYLCHEIVGKAKTERKKRYEKEKKEGSKNHYHDDGCYQSHEAWKP